MGAILRALVGREALPPTATQATAAEPDNPAAEEDEAGAEVGGDVAAAWHGSVSRERLLELCGIVLNQA